MRKKVLDLKSYLEFQKINKHEPIIDKQTWDKVQLLIQKNYKRVSPNPPDLFTGMLVCNDCKHRMSISTTRKTGKDGTIYVHKYTQCNYYRRHRNLNVCSLHSTDYMKLEEEVLKQLDSICKKFIKLVDFEKATKQGKNEKSNLENELIRKINKLESDIAKIDKQIEKVYMDRLDEVITVDTYQKISAKFETTKESLISALDEAKLTYSNYKEDNNDEAILSAKELSKKYIKNRKKLDRDLLLQIVDRIEIHEDKSLDLYLRIKPLEQVM